MPRAPKLLVIPAALLGILALAACGIPYHPQPGQGPYQYTPVPGGGGH
ncbi:MAG TPA: hypothetical protein VMB73_13815 [Acetobacteraceae bacterium]|jgi:hypothetical protein|nr:hypothetical protein [Acetobacteraceae bacterium]